MLNPFHLHRVVVERHRIDVLESPPQEINDGGIVLRLSQVLATVRRFANVSVFDDNLAALQHDTRMTEHAGDIFFLFVNDDVGVTSQSQIALAVQPECPSRAG